jgi:MYXO-CTERM domain-containing protein
VTCGASEVCVAGACKDKCSGAVCPGKASCVDGKCQPPLADADPTGMGGSNVGGGFPLDPFPMAGTLSISGMGGSAGGSKSNPGSPNGPILKSGEMATGCGCRVGASGPGQLTWLVLGALGLIGLRRRRR